MTEADKKRAFSMYLSLAALFITSLVVSNLIFQKFFFWKPFGEFTVFGVPIFELSVGILPYPITFLITDIVSEVFGQKRANQVVTAGIFASFFSLLIILAYRTAQYIVIGLYHFWKRATRGRMLWLRNNFSTFPSQTIDTVTVIGLLCLFEVIPWQYFKGLVISGVIFKIMMALVDTPFL